MPLLDRPFGPISGAANSAYQTGLSVQAAQAGPLPALQAVTVTTEVVISSPENLSIPLIATLRPDTLNEQTVLHLAVSGYVKTTASGTVTLQLRSGTSLTAGSNTALATSGAVTQNTLTAPFRLICELIYDSVSGKLDGDYEFLVNHTLVAKAVLTNQLTGISNSANPVANFVFTITTSGATGGTPTTINVQKFSVG